jgi:hypothetical protein
MLQADGGFLGESSRLDSASKVSSMETGRMVAMHPAPLKC